jgi:HEAT repeat protein
MRGDDTSHEAGLGREQLILALQDPDPFVRVDALGHATPDEATVDVVTEALGDAYPLVRREAVRTLFRIGGSQAARALVGVAAHDLSAEVREEAVAALAGMLRVEGAAGAEA